MPYAIRFSKPIVVTDREQYLNACCIGGDIVLERLLPQLSKHYVKLQSNQEDWGWFAWCEQRGIKLAVDVFTEDDATGRFQLHLTSRKPRFLLTAKIADTPELERLREMVVGELRAWQVSDLHVEHVNDKYVAD